MKTILLATVLLSLAGCCCPWAQVPNNPEYKQVTRESPQ